MNQTTINDLLVKKTQGVAFTSTDFTAAGENAGSALPIILNSNVQGEIIPAVAPTLSTYIDLPDASGASGIDVSGGKIYDTDVNYIKYYEKVILEEKVYNQAYSYPGTILTDFRNTNKLVNAIPGNTDPAGSYAIKVYAENGTDSFTSDSPSRPWLFDNASGYLTFFNGWSKSSLGLPRISYYRYEGKMGAVSDTIDGDLTVTGQVTAASFTATSDVRLKKEIKPLENSLEKICALQGVEFEFINDLIQRKNIGFIAQDIEKIIPQVVSTSEKGDQYKSVAYGNIVALLVEAIKELDKLYTITKEELNNEKEKTQNLENENKLLKTQINDILIKFSLLEERMNKLELVSSSEPMPEPEP